MAARRRLSHLLGVGPTSDEELVGRVSTPSAQHDAGTQHAQQLRGEHRRMAAVRFLAGSRGVQGPNSRTDTGLQGASATGKPAGKRPLHQQLPAEMETGSVCAAHCSLCGRVLGAALTH